MEERAWVDVSMWGRDVRGVDNRYQGHTRGQLGHLPSTKSHRDGGLLAERNNSHEIVAPRALAPSPHDALHDAEETNYGTIDS